MIVANPSRKKWIHMKTFNGYPTIWDDGYSHIKIVGNPELACGIPLTRQERRRVSNSDIPIPDFVSCPKCLAYDSGKSKHIKT